MNLELDIPSLLSPFEGDSRAGTDLRGSNDPDSAYQRIRDARKAADRLEEQAWLKGETSPVAREGWRSVWVDGQVYLKTVAKDLEIVACMIEASVRIGGFAGLDKSLALTAELVQGFWGELLPALDEDGIETTLLPIARLNSKTITSALQRVPITEDKSVGELTLMQYAQSKRLSSLDEHESSRQLKNGAVTIDTFNQAVSESSGEFLRALETQIKLTQASVVRLEDLLVEKAGEVDAPNLSRFHSSLKDALVTLRLISGDRLEEPDQISETNVEASANGDEAEHGSGRSVSSGGIRGGISTRQEALDLLEKVAGWFAKHEPQSILISEIHKVKRRAVMSPEELYKDLISDSSVREQLFRDVGIEPSSEDDS